MAGTFQQQDQRCDPSPIHGSVQSRSARTPRRDDRRGLDGRPVQVARPGTTGRRPRVRPAVASRQAREQGTAVGLHRGPHRNRIGSRLDVRRAGQAHSRVQAPTPQRAAHRHPLQPTQAESHARDRPARVHFRRQGRTRLSHRQTDDQADQLRRRNRQLRPGRQRPHEGGVHPELQCAERPVDLPGRRPLRADLDRRQGGLRHRQHEIHDERGADHRHPRRRQR